MQKTPVLRLLLRTEVVAAAVSPISAAFKFMYAIPKFRDGILSNERKEKNTIHLC